MNSSVVKNRSALLKSQEHSDVKFKIDDRIFPAHKYLLLQSEYFRALFTGQFSEQNEEIIELKDIDADDFEIVLQSLYGINPNLSELDIERKINIFMMAKYFFIEDLANIVGADLHKSVTYENSLQLFQIALMCFEAGLDGCIEQISDNPLKTIQHPDFNDLSPDALEKLISLDTLCAPEIEIFQSVRKWIEVDPDVRAKHKNLLTLIRWNRISDVDFQKIVCDLKLFEDEKEIRLMFEDRFIHAGRYLSVRNKDHCENIKPVVKLFDSAAEFPRYVIRRHNYNYNKLLFATIILPEICLIDCIVFVITNLNMSLDFIIKVAYSDKVVEFKDFNKERWVNVSPFDRSIFRFSHSFSPIRVKQIRIMGIQYTYTAIFGLAEVACFYNSKSEYDELSDW